MWKLLTFFDTEKFGIENEIDQIWLIIKSGFFETTLTSFYIKSYIKSGPTLLEFNSLDLLWLYAFKQFNLSELAFWLSQQWWINGGQQRFNLISINMMRALKVLTDDF